MTSKKAHSRNNDRFKDILTSNFERLMGANLLTLLGFLPLAVGITLSLLSSSILLLIPCCLIGGALAGPAYACMYDAVFRSLRFSPGKCIDNYIRSWKQNWRQAIIPGMILSLIFGFYIFMAALFWWSTKAPSPGTLLVYLAGLIFVLMFCTAFWPQLVLFDQSFRQSFRNCLLFMIQFFWKTLGCAVLYLCYWLIIGLFLPWSVILLPFAGFWLIILATNYLLYPTLRDAFQMEDM